MTKIFAVLILASLFAPKAFAYVPLMKEGYYWRGGYYDFYINPENIPSWVGKKDTRLLGPLSEEVKQEIRIQIFEELMLKKAREWSEIPQSTLVVRYLGRTDIKCGVRDKVYDGVNVLCWRPTADMLVSVGAASGLAVPMGDVDTKIVDGKVVANYFITEVEILLNTSETSAGYNLLESVSSHEIGHALGLGHEDGVAAVMNRGAPAKGIKQPQPDDVAGIQSIYPFNSNCAPIITEVNGQLRFTAHIYLDGQESVRILETSGNVLRVVSEDKNPLLARSCALKPDVYGLIGIPYIKLNGQLYWLILRIAGDVYEIVSYGPVQ